MTKNRSLPVKAMFLLIVFLLNSVIGFACAIGTDIDFNKSHHDHQEVVDDPRHHADLAHHKHTGHIHADHHEHQDEKENCCKDEVAKLTSSNKQMPRFFDIGQLLMPFVGLLSTFYPAVPEPIFPTDVPNACFTMHCRSPIKDVRIAIQSFQI